MQDLLELNNEAHGGVSFVSEPDMFKSVQICERYESERSRDEVLLHRALEILKLGDSYGMGYKVHELISEIEKQLEQ